MKTKLLSVFVLGLSLLNSACSVNSVGSDTVAANSIFQNYMVTYSENSNLTYTDAQFRVRDSLGDTVELLYPSYVLANNAPMSHHSFLGSSYAREFAGYIETMKFQYTDSENKKYENTLEVKPVSITTYSSHVDLNDNYKVELSFSDLREDESLIVRVCQDIGPSEEYPEGKSLCAYGESRTNSVTVKKAGFQDLNPGSAEMTVLRELNTWTGTFGSRGGHLVVRYIAKTVMVNLEDVP